MNSFNNKIIFIFNPIKISQIENDYFTKIDIYNFLNPDLKKLLFEEIFINKSQFSKYFNSKLNLNEVKEFYDKNFPITNFQINNLENLQTNIYIINYKKDDINEYITDELIDFLNNKIINKKYILVISKNKLNSTIKNIFEESKEKPIISYTYISNKLAIIDFNALLQILNIEQIYYIKSLNLNFF